MLKIPTRSGQYNADSIAATSRLKGFLQISQELREVVEIFLLTATVIRHGILPVKINPIKVVCGHETLEGLKELLLIAFRRSEIREQSLGGSRIIESLATNGNEDFEIGIDLLEICQARHQLFLALGGRDDLECI